MKYVAEYRDCAGQSFSAPVSKMNGTWLLATSNGPREISYYIQGSDLAGGFATFYDYRLEDVPRGLRGCDFYELCKEMYRRLPWPRRPAAPPIPEPQDLRVHVEQGDSFRVLQEAGEKATAEYESQRQRARREALNAMNQPNVRQIQQAHAHATEILRARRPRGGGGGFIIDKGE